MATVADNFKDSADRHTVYLLRWSTGTYNRHSKLIDEMVADISTKLAMRAPADGSFTQKRLEAMLAYITERSSQLYKALAFAVDGDYRELAAYEASFQLRAIDAAYPIKMDLNPVTPAKIHSAAMSRPFQGRVLRDWWGNQNYQTREQMQSALRLGFVEDETIPQIVRRIGIVGDMTRRDVNSVVRTATAHMSQVARDKVVEENDELFKGEKLSVTFDGRTSSICIRHGAEDKLYPIGVGPKPPLHFNCRTTRYPVTKSWKELGFDGLDDEQPLSTKPFVADTRRVKDIPKDARDKVVGTTTAKDWDEFLIGQEKTFIPDALGTKRTELYRTGEISLLDLIKRDGSVMTLEEIEKSEKKSLQAAWKKAFG